MTREQQHYIADEIFWKLKWLDAADQREVIRLVNGWLEARREHDNWIKEG